MQFNLKYWPFLQLVLGFRSNPHVGQIVHILGHLLPFAGFAILQKHGESSFELKSHLMKKNVVSIFGEAQQLMPKGKKRKTHPIDSKETR